jgi:histidine triad (HIT) family protein
MATCVFCRIISGEAPASFVLQDATCVAFMDIQPITRGHVLVVPRMHALRLAELDTATVAHLAIEVSRVARSLGRSGIRCEGLNVLLADGEAAGQEVPHVHWHVIPRFRGDGFGFRSGPGYTSLPPRAELDRVADELRPLI